MAWTEQRLKQSVIALLSAEFIAENWVWGFAQLCLLGFQLLLQACPSISWGRAKGCLPAILPALCIVRPVQSGAKILQNWQFVVEPEINGFIQYPWGCSVWILATWFLFLLFLSHQNSCAGVWCCWVLFLTPKLAYLSLNVWYASFERGGILSTVTNEPSC